MLLNGETEVLNKSSLPEGLHLLPEIKLSDLYPPIGNSFLYSAQFAKAVVQRPSMHQNYLWNLLTMEELGLARGWCICIFNKLLN